ncbi:MAG: LAGLIDADG family homing endonuclease [Nanoarchaeota archaeon]
MSVDRQNRVKAYQRLKELKTANTSNKDILQEINKSFQIPIGTIYEWLANRQSPTGSTGKIKYNSELFYVLGALLGDGCAYKWKKGGGYLVNLIGDKDFTEKYANKISKCIERKVKNYINRSKNIYFVNINNLELFMLFKEIRSNLGKIMEMLNKNKEQSLLFLEGFFDAEGCVKIIKEKVRKTPKICLDITNTNYELLEVMRKILEEQLEIEARYSIQKPELGKDGLLRKEAYHLRIYKKEYIKRFFENISTTKLKAEKVDYVNNWLNRESNIKNANNSSLLVTSLQVATSH